jgi:hypothetical protein
VRGRDRTGQRWACLCGCVTLLQASIARLSDDAQLMSIKQQRRVSTAAASAMKFCNNLTRFLSNSKQLIPLISRQFSLLRRYAGRPGNCVCTCLRACFQRQISAHNLRFQQRIRVERLSRINWQCAVCCRYCFGHSASGTSRPRRGHMTAIISTTCQHVSPT